MNKRPNLEGTNPVYKTITVILLIVVVLFFLFPLYWIISGSFKTDIEINAREPVWFPTTPTMEHYQDAHLVPHRTHGGKLRPAV